MEPVKVLVFGGLGTLNIFVRLASFEEVYLYINYRARFYVNGYI
jgi:hypothetical protein